MDTGTDTSLSLTKVIPAAREAVYRAWTDPAEMRLWSCPEGAEITALEVDLRVGGAFTIGMLGEDGSTFTAFGTYREIEAPARLVYTWDWKEADHSVGETVVTVTFNDLGESTEIVLEHDLFPSGEAAEGHRQGWTSVLSKFEARFVA